jgi:hypothetical protein
MVSNGLPSGRSRHSGSRAASCASASVFAAATLSPWCRAIQRATPAS